MNQYSPTVVLSYIIGPILIIVSHIGSIFVLFTGLSWGALLWIISLYFMRMLATTSIYHRLLTHKSYKAPKLITWLGSIIAASAGQMGPSWWKAHHIAHHQYVDQELDPHSPFTPNQGLKGFLWAQGGWLLSPNFFPEKLPADVEKDQVLKVIDRLHFLPVIALAILSYFIGGFEYLVAFFLSTTILFHGVQTVNSLSHLIGKQPFQTDDYSRNNLFVALITFGEGWHNLHHAFPTSSRHGITLNGQKVLYLPDLTFTFIKLLESVGLASKLRIPNEKALLERAKNPNYRPV
ncbi:MAG: acyl-CoA desaturase, partial [Halothece sp.]